MLKTFSNKGKANAIPINAENLNFNFTELINILHPVGEYFYTSDANFNPNTAWCGTWALENDGTVLVSKSNKSDSHPGGNKYTNETGYYARLYFGNDGSALGGEGKTGGDQPHNNIQPSRISFRWHRTA